MAWYNEGNLITLPFASTGIRQYRFVVCDSANGIDYPDASTIGQAITGVLVSSGTTGSTDASAKYGTVQIAGVAKVESEASTSAMGNVISASSVGRAQPSSNPGDHAVGRIVDGSSGGANRILSVHLTPLGSTIQVTA